MEILLLKMMIKNDIFKTTKNNFSNFLRKHKGRLLLFFLIVVFLLLIPSPNIYFRSVEITQGLMLPEQLSLPKPPPVPINYSNETPPMLSASAILIKDLPSGKILYAKDEKMKFLPASTTKIMTAVVALSSYKLDEILTVKTVIGEGRTMGLIPDEKITAESLLYGTLVHSANDAAFALAENYPGGVSKFVEEMNRKAKEYGLSDTYFTNPIGFDDSKNLTTASDLAKLAEIALTNKTFAKIVGTRSITVSDVSFTYFHELKNVNELLGKVAGVSGVKTGFTQNAGEILVSEVKKNNKSVLFVVLKSDNRFGDTAKLIDWVFNNFIWVSVEDIIPTIQKK